MMNMSLVFIAFQPANNITFYQAAIISKEKINVCYIRPDRIIKRFQMLSPVKRMLLSCLMQLQVKQCFAWLSADLPS